MDIELKSRERIISALGTDFDCIQECELQHALFPARKIRADVVAISLKTSCRWAIAFETKVPNPKWEFSNWTGLLKQAVDCTFSRIVDKRVTTLDLDKYINLSVIFPEPNLTKWTSKDSQTTRFYRDYDIEAIRGALLFAQHLKVGSANFDSSKNEKFRIRLGTDTLWRTGEGFRAKAAQRLEKTRLGSSILGS